MQASTVLSYPINGQRFTAVLSAGFFHDAAPSGKRGLPESRRGEFNTRLARSEW